MKTTLTTSLVVSLVAALFVSAPAAPARAQSVPADGPIAPVPTIS